MPSRYIIMVYQKQFILKLTFSGVNSPTHAVLCTRLRKGILVSSAK